MARRPWALVLLAGVAAALGGGSGTARAHLGHEVLSAERYLKLDVAGTTARVVVSLTLGPAEGQRLLVAADADSDGSLSASERDAYLAQWGQGLRDELTVELDGARVPLEWGEPFLDPLGTVGAVPVTVEMVARFPLSGGREQVRITDAMPRREAFDRTDVAFRAREGARLVATGLEDEPTELEPDLTYGPDLSRGSPVHVTAVIESPERPLGESKHWLVLAGAALAALLALGFRFAGRSRRA